MIQPNNPITLPTQTADGIWVSSIAIQAPSTIKPVTATIRLTPYNSESGSLFPSLSKTIVINNVYSASASNATLATAMQNIFVAVQDLVTSGSLF